MKKNGILLIASLIVVFQAVIVFSAEVQKGIIKSVDPKTGTVIFSSTTGQDATLTADKSLELDAIKPGDKVEILVENNTMKSIKPDRVSWCPKGF